MKCALPLLLFAGLHAPTVHAQDDPGTWQAYGGSVQGRRYSSLAQIDRSNVGRLAVAWTFHMGAPRTDVLQDRAAALESTPIVVGDTLYVTSPFDVVFALHAASGRELWRYDPKIGHSGWRSHVTSRGVAVWRDAAFAPAVCRERIFLGTIDGRLIALDGATGKPCADFGQQGVVDLKQGVDHGNDNDYEITSAPTVVGDVVVVGSSIADNHKVDVEDGVVRGFDARTGRLVWSWEPIPWAMRQKPRTGAANAWSTISADVGRGLIFVPTGSASPDFYGVLRPGDGRDADSVVALDAATGRKVWAFQTVHHDLWDYDVASEPVLFLFRGVTPAIAITTKTGQLFVLDRTNGRPLFPVSEVPVPPSKIPGEKSSPTQPISSLPPLAPLTFTAAQAWGRDDADRAYCKNTMEHLRNEGLYTPPGEDGSLLYPGSVGGVNWGSPAIDPVTNTLVVNVNRLPYRIRLLSRMQLRENWWKLQWHRAETGFFLLLRRVMHRGWLDSRLSWLRFTVDEETRIDTVVSFGRELSVDEGTPYWLYREPLLAPSGLPCTPPPWGTVTAIHLDTGTRLWQVPLGTRIAGEHTGSVNLGGPMLTAGGSVFVAASKEPSLHAYDEATGAELWKGALPVPAQATPMTYSAGGRQFVVVSAGGHGDFETPQGDAVVAFSLQ